MGTWDVGAFGNDTAAAFAGGLDEIAAGEREGAVRSPRRAPQAVGAHPLSRGAAAWPAGAWHVGDVRPGSLPVEPRAVTFRRARSSYW
ncbi:DUF4259 domain-containing protein [Streptomyces sp. NPDC057336]|uniref:DUF4259 domain-containing protein n=1 Tax=Streptomyces sp. NPDC057336 TaxID=3346102 RepID=UPI0036254897